MCHTKREINTRHGGFKHIRSGNWLSVKLPVEIIVLRIVLTKIDIENISKLSDDCLLSDERYAGLFS